MATITFNGESFTVDHAVKGDDFVHGYDADGNCIISIDGVSDFSDIAYDGVYMAPGDCLAEACNNVKYCGGELKTAGGDTIDMCRNGKWWQDGERGYTSGSIDFGDDVAFYVIMVWPDAMNQRYSPYYTGKVYFLRDGDFLNITETLTDDDNYTSASRGFSTSNGTVTIDACPQGAGYVVPVMICAIRALDI